MVPPTPQSFSGTRSGQFPRAVAMSIPADADAAPGTATGGSEAVGPPPPGGKGAADGVMKAAEDAPATPQPGSSTLDAAIEELKEQQAKLLKERKKVTSDLKNAARKRRRLKEKARNLSDADLVELMALRHKDRKGAAVRDTPEVETSAAGSVSSPKGTSDSVSVTASASSERSPEE